MSDTLTIPKCSGPALYILIKHPNSVIYVGRSFRSTQGRIADHHDKDWDSARVYLTNMSTDVIHCVESILIRLTGLHHNNCAMARQTKKLHGSRPSIPLNEMEELINTATQATLTAKWLDHTTIAARLKNPA